MKGMRVYMIGFMMLGLFLSTSAIAGSAEKGTPVYQMAEILHRLKHFPSPAGKAILQQIVLNPSATANEHAIATAMINLQHHASAADIPKLKAIIDDKKAAKNERDLAEIILNLDHRPTKSDKAILKAMME